MTRFFKFNVSMPMFALAVAAGLAAGWSLHTAVGEVTPPTTDKGISREAPVEVDLGPDLPGYKLRMIVVTFEPGAVRAIHDHKKNPEATYIVGGTFTEYRRGGFVKDFGKGATRTNGREVEHWLENRGAEKAVQVVATVVKAQ